MASDYPLIYMYSYSSYNYPSEMQLIVRLYIIVLLSDYLTTIIHITVLYRYIQM